MKSMGPKATGPGAQQRGLDMLTTLVELQRAPAPLGQPHDGHHLGSQAGAPLLAGRDADGVGAAPRALLHAVHLPADAGAAHHIPARRRAGVPVEHGGALRGGISCGDSGVGQGGTALPPGCSAGQDPQGDGCTPRWPCALRLHHPQPDTPNPTTATAVPTPIPTCWPCPLPSTTLVPSPRCFPSP